MRNCLVLPYLCKLTESKLSFHCRGKKGLAVIQAQHGHWHGAVWALALPDGEWPEALQDAWVHPSLDFCHNSVISPRKMDCKGSNKSPVTTTHWWEHSTRPSASVSSLFWIFLCPFLSTRAAAADPTETWVYPGWDRAVSGGTAQRAAALELWTHPQHLLQCSAFRNAGLKGWAPNPLLGKHHHPAVQSRFTPSILLFSVISGR